MNRFVGCVLLFLSPAAYGQDTPKALPNLTGDKRPDVAASLPAHLQPIHSSSLHAMDWLQCANSLNLRFTCS
ncbi:MAG: hypothetical protein WCL32_26305 [Planctomycetota bacterium]